MKEHHEAPRIVHAVLWSLASILAIIFVVLLTLYLMGKVPIATIEYGPNF